MTETTYPLPRLCRLVVIIGANCRKHCRICGEICGVRLLSDAGAGRRAGTRVERRDSFILDDFFQLGALSKFFRSRSSLWRRQRPRQDNFKPLERNEAPCVLRMWFDERGLGRVMLPGQTVERSLFSATFEVVSTT